MGTRSGELREILISAIEDVRSSKLPAPDAQAIAKLAGQVTLSLQVELNARRDGLIGPKVEIGALPLGDENTVDMVTPKGLPGVEPAAAGCDAP